MPAKNNSNKPIKILKEKADNDRILKLIASPELTSEEKDALHKYRHKIFGEYVSVNYYFSKGCNNFGRLYAENSLSLQNFRKGIRHALASDIYDDIDMVNAHPVLLAQYCDKNNIKCKLLKNYVNNREDWLNEIMNFHNISRDHAKKLVLKLCYLGNYELDDEFGVVNRCCICHEISNIDLLLDINQKHNIRICNGCNSEGMRRCNEAESNGFIEDIELFFIDMYNEYHESPVDETTTVKILDELLDACYSINSDDRLPKLENFSTELKSIADSVYKIEKEIADIVKKNDNKSNKKSSVLSMTAQVLEHKCLMSMHKFFESKKYKVGVYCFDGLMVEKNDKPIDNALLKKCSEFVNRETGYNIKLEIKPMNLGIPIPELSEFVEDDKEVQEKLFILENPDFFKFCKKDLYVFNETTGMFETQNEALNYYIIKHSNYFTKEISYSSKKSTFKNYGRDATLMSKVAPFVNVAARDNNWLDRTAHTSLGHLLFKDGIYNMKTGVFSKGFNPNIVFHNCIPHEFPVRNEEEVKYAANMSFNLMFDNPMPLIVAFARALAGDISPKKFYFCPGKTNAGKSKLVIMFVNSFGSFIGNFNAEDLAYSSKNDAKDEGSKNRWAYLIRFSRIIFSNEVNMKKILNGNCIKKMSSGGDKIIGRTHYEEETQFVPHFTPFCMLNDIPKIDPLDDAVYERLVYCEFKKQFVEKVTQDHHIEADPELDEKIRDPKFIRGFIHLILDGYNYFLKHGQPEFDNITKEEWTEADRKDKNLKELLLGDFEITNSKDDFVTVSHMNKFRIKHKKEFSTISSKRFNEIVQSVFKISQTRKGKNGTRGWVGIRVKEIDYDMD